MQRSAEKGFNEGPDGFVLGICKEEILETGTGNGALDQILVKRLEAGYQILEIVQADLIQDLLVPLLGNHTVGGVAVSAAESKELFKDIFNKCLNCSFFFYFKIKNKIKR